MELRQLRYFSIVAQEQHLTRAAERLGIRATSVSQQIIALERELGVALFHRRSSGMVPTAAGRALLPHAYRALEAVEAGAAAVRLGAAGAPWRVGITPGTSGEVVAALRGSAPNADLRDLPVAHQLRLLRSGDLDAGVIVLPAETRNLRVRMISAEPLGVLMSSAHPLAARGVSSWSDLADQELLWFERELAPGYHDAMLDCFRKLGWQPRRVRRGPPRRGLFVAELLHGSGVVAIRPQWDRSADLVWLPMLDAPKLCHAMVWDAAHSSGGQLAAIAAELAGEV